MTKILIAYGTSEGQTAQIADHLAGVIRGRGLEVEALDLKQFKDVSVAGYDAVIIGGSVHMGKHQEDVVNFVRKNRVDLERLPSAFFSVSLAAHGDEAEAEGYVVAFEKETGWHPAQVALFAGALPYTHYGFLKRHLMKKIAADKPGSLGTDTSRDYVYTDWDEVSRFTEAFLERLLSTDHTARA